MSWEVFYVVGCTFSVTVYLSRPPLHLIYSVIYMLPKAFANIPPNIL